MSQYDIIIADWNGTLIEDKDETLITGFVAKGLVRDRFRLHIAQSVRLLEARRKFKQIVKQYDVPLSEYSADMLAQVYDICDYAIKGASIELVTSQVDKYAIDAHKRLDLRMLRPISQAHREGKRVGVLSIGLRYGIERILEEGGYLDMFEFIEAVEMKTDESDKSKVSGLSFQIDKAAWLRTVLAGIGVSPDRAVYMGDSRHDEPCFEMVGFPIVSFHASDGFKQSCALKYGADCVPDSESDLLTYFQTI